MEDYVKNTAEEIRKNPKKETWENIDRALSKSKRRGLWFLLIAFFALAGGSVLFYYQNNSIKEDASTQEVQMESKELSTKRIEIEPIDLTDEPIGTVESTLDYSLALNQNLNLANHKRNGEHAVKPVTAQNQPNEMNPISSATSGEPDQETKRQINQTPSESVLLDLTDARQEGSLNELLDENSLDTIRHIEIIVPIMPVEPKWKMYAFGGMGRTFYHSSERTEILVSSTPVSSFPKKVQTFEYRENTDVPGLGINAGLRIERRLSKRLSVGFGFNYGSYQWSSTVGLEKTRYIYPDAVYLVDTVQDGSGIAQILQWELEKDENGYVYGNSNKITSKLNYLSLPVYAKWNIKKSKRYSFSATAGVSPSLLTRANVLTYNTYIKSYILTHQRANTLRKGGFEFNGSVAIEYAINKQFGLLIEPIFKWQIRSFLHESEVAIPNNPKAYYTGANLGVSYTFKAN